MSNDAVMQLAAGVCGGTGLCLPGGVVPGGKKKRRYLSRLVYHRVRFVRFVVGYGIVWLLRVARRLIRLRVPSRY